MLTLIFFIIFVAIMVMSPYAKKKLKKHNLQAIMGKKLAMKRNNKKSESEEDKRKSTGLGSPGKRGMNASNMCQTDIKTAKND